MTATDELRALLGERGVEWFESITRKGLTWICQDGKTIRFHPWQHNTLKVSMFDLTPEQAIAATLGDVPRLPYFWTADGTLHIELPRLPESISVRLPEQRDRDVGSARTWQYTQGSGTCRAIVSDNLTESEGMGDAWADCSECGHLLFVLTDPNSEPPNFCPNCGAKVIG